MKEQYSRHAGYPFSRANTRSPWLYVLSAWAFAAFLPPLPPNDLLPDPPVAGRATFFLSDDVGLALDADAGLDAGVSVADAGAGAASGAGAGAGAGADADAASSVDIVSVCWWMSTQCRQCLYPAASSYPRTYTWD